MNRDNVFILIYIIYICNCKYVDIIFLMVERVFGLKEFGWEMIDIMYDII